MNHTQLAELTEVRIPCSESIDQKPRCHQSFSVTKHGTAPTPPMHMNCFRTGFLYGSVDAGALAAVHLQPASAAEISCKSMSDRRFSDPRFGRLGVTVNTVAEH
jgi:hypothetical protein